MKKLISILVTAAIICAMSGCAAPSNKEGDATSTGNPTKTSSSSKSEPEETAAPEKSVLSLGETITFDKWEISVNSADITDHIDNSAYTSFKPDEGNVYVTVNITVKNIDTNAATFMPSFSTNKDIKAKLVYGEYEFNATNLLAYSDELHDTHLNPLSSKTGMLTFSVTKDIADLKTLNLVIFKNNKDYTFSLSN